MDPNVMHSPTGLELPRPTSEVSPDTPQSDQTAERAKPMEGDRTEQPGSSMPGPAPLVPPADPTGPTVAAPLPPIATPATDDHSPAIADDADLIEKEWVTKAKAIVARTRDDPNLQNKEINKFKASYIKKRYNKDIRVGDE